MSGMKNKNVINDHEKEYIRILHETEKQKKNGLIFEAYDSKTNTYKTEATLVMYGDSYSSESGSSTKKAYKFSFPKGSPVFFTKVGSYTTDYITLDGGTMDGKKVGVTLNCDQGYFKYWDSGKFGYVTLYDDGTMLPNFVSRMKKMFCVTNTTVKSNNTNINNKTDVDTQKKQCALKCEERYPYYSVVCDGSNWNTTLKSWISEKGGSDNKETYIALKTSWCSGWRPGQTQQTLRDFVVPTFPGSETTTVTQNQNQETSVY